MEVGEILKKKIMYVYMYIHIHMYRRDHRSFSGLLESAHFEVSWLDQVLTDYESLGEIH